MHNDIPEIARAQVVMPSCGHAREAARARSRRPVSARQTLPLQASPPHHTTAPSCCAGCCAPPRCAPERQHNAAWARLGGRPSARRMARGRDPVNLLNKIRKEDSRSGPPALITHHFPEGPHRRLEHPQGPHRAYGTPRAARCAARPVGAPSPAWNNMVTSAPAAAGLTQRWRFPQSVPDRICSTPHGNVVTIRSAGGAS